MQKSGSKRPVAFKDAPEHFSRPATLRRCRAARRPRPIPGIIGGRRVSPLSSVIEQAAYDHLVGKLLEM
jgi:hypothetical protein